MEEETIDKMLTTEKEASDEETEMTYEQYLLYAARVGDVDGVNECIVDEKISPNTVEESSGNTALHMACANGFDQMV